MSYTQSIGRVYEANDFYIWDSSKKREISGLNLNFSKALNERQQILINSGVLFSSFQDNTGLNQANHASDTLLGYSYEALPEYSFSAWKPNIHLSALVNVPTGHSIYDTNYLSEGSDVTGFNQWGAGVGVSMRKVYFPISITWQSKGLLLLPKKFSAVEVSNFWDISTAVFANYSTNFWGLSSTVGMTWNQTLPKTLVNTGVTSSTTQVTTLIVSIQKVIDENFSLGISYSDQTLIGNPSNTLLNRIVSANLSYMKF